MQWQFLIFRHHANLMLCLNCLNYMILHWHLVNYKLYYSTVYTCSPLPFCASNFYNRYKMYYVCLGILASNSFNLLKVWELTGGQRSEIFLSWILLALIKSLGTNWSVLKGSEYLFPTLLLLALIKSLETDWSVIRSWKF